MNALRHSLKELKVILIKVPFLKPLISQGKYIFAVGGFVWIVGGFIPDTAHFAVTFFSSIGRAAVFTGLFFTFVKGDEERFVLTVSVIICIASLIIIIVEIASYIYMGSFESYLFLWIFLLLAVNSSKYLKNKSWYDEPEKDKPRTILSDYLSYPSAEAEQPEQTETFMQDDPKVPPEAPVQPPVQPYAQPKPPTQDTPPSVPPEAPVQPIKTEAKSKVPPQETVSAQPEASSDTAEDTAQEKDPNPAKIQRVPSIGSAPSIGPAPSIKIKPKE